MTADMPDAVKVLERLIATARLLYANAEGCAVNHHGADFELHGMPGWLTDCAADIAAAQSLGARAMQAAMPTPAGAGDLVERLREPMSQIEGTDDEWLARVVHEREEAASRIEALEAEVERLRMAVRNDTATIGKYEEHRQKLHAARTTAEAERDAWRERESETQEALQKIGEEFGIHGGEPRVDGLLRVLREQRTDLAALKAEVERKNKALREAGEAIAEYFRYLHGGETRGSYDGKPEREGLRKAGYAVSRALAPAKAGG